jgi:siroheme synthase-like protein
MEKEPATHPQVYPVALVVFGQPCLVVGGGRVAARKIGGLLACGAAVTVVAPEVHEAIAALSADGAIAAVEGPPLDVQLRPYRPGEAGGYRLVFAATGDPEIDAAVHRDADTAGVWVNSADDMSHCSFVLPAVMRDGPVTVAVSTSGASPALAAWLRDQVAEALGNRVGDLARLMAQARQRVKDRGGSTEVVEWERLLEGRLPSLVAQGRFDEARAILDAAVEGSAEAPPPLEPGPTQTPPTA